MARLESLTGDLCVLVFAFVGDFASLARARQCSRGIQRLLEPSATSLQIWVRARPPCLAKALVKNLELQHLRMLHAIFRFTHAEVRAQRGLALLTASTDGRHDLVRWLVETFQMTDADVRDAAGLHPNDSGAESDSDDDSNSEDGWESVDLSDEKFDDPYLAAAAADAIEARQTFFAAQETAATALPRRVRESKAQIRVKRRAAKIQYNRFTRRARNWRNDDTLSFAARCAAAAAALETIRQGGADEPVPPRPPTKQKSPRSDRQYLPIVRASARGHLSIVRLLLDDVVLDKADNYAAARALLEACRNGHLDVAKCLRDRQFNRFDRADLLNAFVQACGNGFADVVGWMADQYGVEWHELMNRHRATIARANANGHYPVLEILTKKFGAANMASVIGATPHHRAPQAAYGALPAGVYAYAIRDPHANSCIV
jgi:hypothetical protein